jgi:hypothetical protein
MPHKQVLFRSAAREKILRGATQLCDAVRVTLGPKSKSVLIQKSWDRRSSATTFLRNPFHVLRPAPTSAAEPMQTARPES